MKKLILIAVLFTSFNAFAGVFIEPVVGYAAVGKWKHEDQDLSDGDDSINADLKVLSYGLRAGYSLGPFMAGAEYGGSLSGNIDDSGSVDYSETRIGVFAGYTIIPTLRARLGYEFQHNLEVAFPTASGGTLTNEGSGFYFGADFTGLPFVNVGLAYHIFSGDTSKNTVQGDLSSVFNWSGNYLILNVSYPWELPIL